MHIRIIRQCHMFADRGFLSWKQPPLCRCENVPRTLEATRKNRSSGRTEARNLSAHYIPPSCEETQSCTTSAHYPAYPRHWLKYFIKEAYCYLDSHTLGSCMLYGAAAAASKILYRFGKIITSVSCFRWMFVYPGNR